MNAAAPLIEESDGFMLVKLIDIKGKEYWLNPVYVKAVTSNPKNGVTEIHCSPFGAAGWWGVSTIKVKAPADEVAAALTEAMPGNTPYAALATDEDEARRSQQQAAASTMIG